MLIKATEELRQVAAAFAKVTAQLGDIAAVLANGAAEGRDSGRLGEPGDAVVAPAGSEEVKVAHEEIGTTTSAECPFLLNKE